MSGRCVALDESVLERALAQLAWTGTVEQAVSFPERLLGMTVRAPCRADGRVRIMVFPRCRSVHTWFMRYPLDIAFIDDVGTVVARHGAVPAWRVLSHPHAAAVLERAAMAGCVPGERPVRYLAWVCLPCAAELWPAWGCAREPPGASRIFAKARGAAWSVPQKFFGSTLDRLAGFGIVIELSLTADTAR